MVAREKLGLARARARGCRCGRERYIVSARAFIYDARERAARSVPINGVANFTMFNLGGSF